MIVIAVTGFAIFIISIPFVVCLYRRQRVVHHQTYRNAILEINSKFLAFFPFFSVFFFHFGNIFSVIYNFGGGYRENVASVAMNMQPRSPRVRRTTGPPKFVNSKSMFRGDTPPNYKQLRIVQKWAKKSKNEQKWTKMNKKGSSSEFWTLFFCVILSWPFFRFSNNFQLFCGTAQSRTVKV